MDGWIMGVCVSSYVLITNILHVAVVLAEMATRLSPWREAKSPEELIQRVQNGLRPYDLPQFPHIMGSSLQNIIPIVQSCWAQDGRMRMPIGDVVQALATLEQRAEK